MLGRLATIVKCFSDCPTGKTADVLRRQVQADKALMKRLNEWRQKRDVARLYKNAELYYQVKSYDKAREYYEQLIKDSFICKELQTFSNVLNFMENPRLFNLYPQVFSGLFEKLMWIDEQPKQKISTTVLQELRSSLLNMDTIRDGLNFLKI